jgi:hypothetical protein
MNRILALCVILTLSGCATLTADSDELITVETTPTGAHCSLKNDAGNWEIAKTPGSVKVDRSFSPLVIRCEKGKLVGDATLAPATRNRAYGNILLLGYPAFIDAGTGAGYEYEQATIKITLAPQKK